MISLDNEAALAHLEDAWDVQMDPSKVLTLKDMTSPVYRDGFSRSRSLGSAGYRDAALWARFTIRRPQGLVGDWVLVLEVPYLTDIQVHGPVAGGQAFLGNSVPLRDRPLRTAQLAVPLTLGEGESAEVHLRIWSHGTLNVRGRILPLAQATEVFEFQTFLGGALLGALVLAVLLNFALGLWSRDNLILVYAAYLTTLVALFLGTTGLVSLLFPTFGGLGPSVLCGFASLGGIPTGLMLWARILRLWSWNRSLWGLYVLLSLGAIGAMGTLGTSWYGRVAPVFFLVALAMGFVSLALALLARRRGRSLDVGLWFIGALAILSLATLVTLATNIGLLPSTELTNNAHLVGVVAHAVLINVGLAGRLRGGALARSKAEQRALFETRRGEEQRQFIAMLVHEFRSPLAAIDRAARMIEVKGGSSDKGSTERLGRIRGLVERLSVLVDSFLASEALEHGGISLDRRDLAVRDLLRDLVAGLDDGSGEKGEKGRLTIAVNPLDLVWDLDREMAMTAIGNVIVNALKYSGTEPVVVEAFTDSRDSLRVTVTDRGPGLSLEDRDRMGDLYYRGSAASGTRGTGLGLTITRKVMAAHGCTLSFQAAPMGGTRVVLIFPPAPSEEELFF
ncbi:MAG: sensor histidine kinase [Rhodospirillum sp.]|nr:sensor histidine kinase [Rhodospirillum sp.]